MKKKIILGILMFGILCSTIILIEYFQYKKEQSLKTYKNIPAKIEKEIKTIEIRTKLEKTPIFQINANIKDVVVSEEIKNVYLFYGDGCPYCEQEIDFLKELSKENPENFNLYAFEVWHKKENKDFLEKVGETLKTNSDLVPMLVIGDEVIIGFSEKNKEEIKWKLQEKQTRDIYKEIYKK